MSSQMVDETRSIPTLRHKGFFAYESSVPPMARADGSAEHEAKKKLESV
jgi:hypothetical protein